MPPGPDRNMVVDRQEFAALRTREAHSRFVFCLNIDPFIDLIDQHIDNIPGRGQTQQHGVQFRDIHGRSPPRASAYPAPYPQKSRMNPFSSEWHSDLSM